MPFNIPERYRQNKGRGSVKLAAVDVTITKSRIRRNLEITVICG
jgi:hypothetical protein